MIDIRAKEFSESDADVYITPNQASDDWPEKPRSWFLNVSAFIYSMAVKRRNDRYGYEYHEAPIDDSHGEDFKELATRRRNRSCLSIGYRSIKSLLWSLTFTILCLL